MLRQAANFHAQGMLAQAESLYRAVLGVQPRHPEALRSLGVLRRDAGDLHNALQLLRDASRAQPREPLVWLELALVCLQAGDLQEAGRAVRKAVQINAALPEAHLLLAQIALGAGDATGARASAERALKLRPGWPDAMVLAGTASAMAGDHAAAERFCRDAIARIGPHPGLSLNLANALSLQGLHDQAVAEYGTALRLDPSQPETHRQLSRTLHLLGRDDDALRSIDRAVELAPGWALACFDRGNLLHALGRFAEAESNFLGAVSAQPDHADAWYNLGLARLVQDHLAGAEAAFRKVVGLRPGHADATDCLAVICYERGEHDEGVALCAAAIALQPEAAQLYMRMGYGLQVMGRYPEALDAYAGAASSAIDKSSPVFQDARTMRAMMLLAMGRYGEGWRAYLQRPGRSGRLSDPGAMPERLEGKTVLVVSDQGVGDEIFFLRFTEALAARGAKLRLDCNPKLAGLLARHESFTTLPPGSVAAQVCDYTLLGGDLPAASGLGLAPPLSLGAEPDRRQRAMEMLAQLGPPPYVGVTWRAGLSLEEAGEKGVRPQVKAIPPDVLGKCLRPLKATVVMLQRKPGEAERAAFEYGLGRRAHDLSWLNDELEDMLAVLACLDEYIGVSNANMHLMAGIAGGRARVLVAHPPEWRWAGRPGDPSGESPWFPGFRVYRRQQAGGWAPVLATLASDLGLERCEPAPSVQWSREHPSPRYRYLVEQHWQMHEQGEHFRGLPAEHVFSGAGLLRHASRIRQLMQRTESRTVLDYGCGKGRQYDWRNLDLPGVGRVTSIREYWGAGEVARHDPCYAPYAQLLPGSHDAVICTDVLQHCADEDLEWIVGELFHRAGSFVFASVIAGPSRKHLPGGGNAHSTVRDASFWEALFVRHADRRPGVLWELWVGSGSHGDREEKRLGNY